jgi:hypothetical protein
LAVCAWAGALAGGVGAVAGGLLVAPCLGCYFLGAFVRGRSCQCPGLEDKAATKRQLLSAWQAREAARAKADAADARARLVAERFQQAALKAALKEDADARFAEVRPTTLVEPTQLGIPFSSFEPPNCSFSPLAH